MVRLRVCLGVDYSSPFFWLDGSTVIFVSLVTGRVVFSLVNLPRLFFLLVCSFSGASLIRNDIYYDGSLRFVVDLGSDWFDACDLLSLHLLCGTNAAGRCDSDDERGQSRG